MTFYCPKCWNEVAAEVGFCPSCGALVQQLLAEQDYGDKLIAALNHPEPTTRIRAAWILGERQEMRAVEPLMRVVHECHDPFIVEAAVEALGKIGDPRCREVLHTAALHGAVRVREKALAALERLLMREKSHDEDRLRSKPGRSWTPGAKETGGDLAMSSRREARSNVVSGGARGWLNQNVLGLGLTSFFSDFSHEMATAILPIFLGSIGASAAMLGGIEGVADAVSSFVKLGAGWVSDRSGQRKPLVVLGYFLTGIVKATFALATSWWHVLLGRVIGWFGRGLRTPLRDAMLADAVPQEAAGRAFGFHRAADTLGAVVGPLTAFLLAGTLTYRQIFLLTLLPGLLSVASIVLLVKEKPRAANHGLRFWKTLRGLPTAFTRFLVGVGIFGIGDFAHTLLILRASELLMPSLGQAKAGQLSVLLYVAHNILYAPSSYLIGALGDRIGKRGLLAFGYFLSAIMGLGFVIALPSFWYLVPLFAIGGIYLGIEDALEGAIAADLLPEEVRGTGYGVLATVNGVGDFASSVIVGALWAGSGPTAAFSFAAFLSAMGTVVLLGIQ